MIIFIGACAAGLIGSLTGLGGGVIIIPLLSYMGIDFHYAIGTALVAVIATSSGSAAAYVKEGVTNMRIGMFLEIATTIGAVVGAFLVASRIVPLNIVAIIFGLILIFSAINSIRKKNEIILSTSSQQAIRLKLNGSYPSGHGEIKYGVTNIIGGFFMMLLAGILSGLLGIGSGAMKVIAMDNVMKIPFKVSTTTSNFMIGVTAAAGAFIYLQKGFITPQLCFPVVVGVLLGAMIGSKILLKSDTSKLRKVFAVIIFAVAINMIYKGIAGNV
ncbi:MAG: sulfite exporter TauE/SafE family protein [Arachidicoccus sp.]|nr:sulfite exporter TauE/SafE family protein [Arachidicoccus sp.]